MTIITQNEKRQRGIFGWLFLLATSLAVPTTAIAEDAWPVDLKPVPAEVDMLQCRQALTVGQMLGSDGTTHRVFLDPLLFIIQVDDTGMKCRAVRHVHK